MSSCHDYCRPGFIPGPPAPNYASGCSLAENPTFKTFVLPASVGTDEPGQPYAPKIGEFRNAIVIYEANGNIYIYDSLGTPTLMEKGNYNGGGGGFPSVEVVQTKGTSLTSVMSQNAVSNELNSLDTQIINTNASLANVNNSVNTLTEMSNSLSERVKVIETEGAGGPPVVQTQGSSTTSVMSQNAVTVALSDLSTRIDNISGGGTGVVVSQTTGQSTTAVMSQKAVTDLFGDVQSLIQRLDTGAGV